jgi:LacI family repressor for deo operon, udp, cdd, tsx, nupC, and nupG
VALCEAIPGADIPQIEVDNRLGAQTMTRYLASLGHRRIAYVTGPRGNVLEQERMAGYCDGLRTDAIAFDESLIITGDYTVESGVAAGRDLLARASPPTAVFCSSDQMAIGLMRTLHSAGLRVPQDISVAGFDDIEFAAVAEPALTTIHQPRRELGQGAATVLIDLLSGRTTADRIRLDTQLVIRDSTASPKA